MLEPSVFCDESGGMDGNSKYRIVTLVFHNQDYEISQCIKAYEQDLNNKGIPNIAFHTGPLMFGKPPYDIYDIAARRRMLASFSFFQSRLPFQYHSFVYKRSDFKNEQAFMAGFKRDLVVFLADNLDYFQSFNQIKLYYDNGQQTITNALHAALEYELSKQVLLYKDDVTPTKYRLSQVADFLCTIELLALKFDNSEISGTDEKFFGLSAVTFKRNYLKKIRKKLL